MIVEVYGLHIGFVTLTMWLLLRWEARPSTPRLACFFAVYACGFGNHLSMILLAPAYTFFLLASAPRGWRSLLRPRIVALAVLLAATGAAQYAWNLRTLWFAAVPPHGVIDAIQLAWFDITKSDWRDTMVMHVPRVMLADHAAMYLFDLRQQFGWAALPVAGRWRGRSVGGQLAARRAAAGRILRMSPSRSDTTSETRTSSIFRRTRSLLLTAPGLVAWRAAARRERAAGGRRDRLRVPRLRRLSRARSQRRSAAHRDPRSPDGAPRRSTRRPDHRSRLAVQNGLTYYGKRLHPEIAYARMPESCSMRRRWSATMRPSGVTSP